MEHKQQTFVEMLEQLLKEAEARHKALVAGYRAQGANTRAMQENVDWTPFYARYLSEQLGGVRVPLAQDRSTQTTVHEAVMIPCAPEYEGCAVTITPRVSLSFGLDNAHEIPQGGYTE